MQLTELLEGLDYQLIRGSINREITEVINDSRKAAPGAVFFCICGNVRDGHDFAPQVVADGASVLITEHEVELPEDTEVTVIQVKDSRYAMALMSAAYYGHPSKELTVIGITGTKGKTTTSYMIRSMLEKSGRKTGLIGTIEILYGDYAKEASHTTPESMELQKMLRDMVDAGMDSVVMEVSSQGLMLDRVAGIDFDYGIFTNLSEDHIGPGEHKTFREYMEWKSKLFTMCRHGIFNIDDPYVDEMTAHATCDITTFGEGRGDYMASNRELFRTEGVLGIRYLLSGRAEAEMEVEIPGTFSLYNSLSAMALACEMGITPETACEALKSVQVRGRVELVPISDQFTLLIDYAHNAMSLESLLHTLREYNPERIITVFGCGGNRSKARRFEMGEVSGKLSDFTIITSDNPRFEKPEDIIADIVTGISKTRGKHIEIIDRKEAFRYALVHAEPGDIIVLAGKGHETYQEIEGVKHPMDERQLIKEVLEEEDAGKICGYHH